MTSRAVHALGNGSLLIYGQGPDIMSIHPGDYSTPSIASLLCEEDLDASTSRNPGANSWNSMLRRGQGEMTFWDAMDPEYNLFRRVVRSHYYTTLSLRIHPSARLYRFRAYDFGAAARDCVCVILPKGTLYFTGNVTAREYRLYILCGGCVRFDETESAMQVSPGEGMITLIAAQTPDIDRHLPAAIGALDVFSRSNQYWTRFFCKITSRTPENPVLDKATESTAALIRAQQSRDGGVVAGHFYPMAYVRDQAGVVRGLLRMGLWDEASSVVRFWARKFAHFGDLLDAESMGHDDARLPFSNDRVELPAYVILSSFAVAEKSPSPKEYLAPLFPMLSWAAHAQASECADGMTGFSGDETYIAGGQFPRYALYEGSAESTMLLILSLEKYLSHFGPDDALAGTLSEAKSRFRDHFMQNGRLMANDPSRLAAKKPPRFHFGYCDACILLGRPEPLTWLERTPDGLYRCPDCRDAQIPDLPPRRPLPLGSVGLLPAWHGFDLVTDDELSATAAPYVERFEKAGYLTSSPDGSSALGYDYALLLCALTRLRHPSLQKVLDGTLSLLDEAGAWAEYYRGKEPYNCRCRPWESAMNISSVLDAWQSLKAQ